MSKCAATRRNWLGEVLGWASANLDRPLSVQDLAARAHLAPRTLARRFRTEVGTTPHRWLTQQRVALAQRMLETTTASVDQIAGEAGFGSAVTLRHHFHQILGTSPTAYRQQFRQAAVRTNDDAALSGPASYPLPDPNPNAAAA